ncbi:hypothetical protein QP157_19505 [Sphingomonas sp. LR61]
MTGPDDQRGFQNLQTSFADRHIGTTPADQQTMLDTVGRPSLDALVRAAIPESIHAAPVTDSVIPAAVGETEALAELRAKAGRNTVRRAMIGLGYHGTHTPAVIQRNVLENPSWYTAYTPYQPEISQGRLEALINFQTMVSDLTGMATAGASMLDEGTAVVEGMLLARRASKVKGDAFLVDDDLLPQTRALLDHRADAVGITLRAFDPVTGPTDAQLDGAFGVIVQYPGASGRIVDPSSIIERVHAGGGIAVVAADLLAMTLLASPGDLGADVAVGTSQRFGVPLGFGGPHAGYLAVRAGLERQLPGRLVGVSFDADGAMAYRLSLQTREQHIRREKATSNICTAQVLLAVMASMYAVYHGPEGLRFIANRVARTTSALAAVARDAGLEVVHDAFFDTLTLRATGRAGAVVAAAQDADFLLHQVDEDVFQLSVDETTTPDDVARLAGVFGAVDVTVPAIEATVRDAATGLPAGLLRESEYLTHPVFSAHRSETRMMRYLKHLADKDYALDRGMIPLGSCTMKLNAATEMAAVTWPEFANIHPFAPRGDVEGYLDMIGDLESWLAEVTGYDTVSLQPNAGSQGELAGLLAIRGYHLANGDTERTVCLIPSSAHGTERRVRGARRHEGRRGRLRRERQRRPRRPPREDGTARRHPRGADDHVPVDPRRVRARHPRDLRRRARRRRAGLRRRREPQRPARPRPLRRLRRRRLAPQPAQDLLHPARRWRTRCRSGRGEGAPGAVPAGAPVRPAGRPTARFDRGRGRRPTGARRRPGQRGPVRQPEHPAHHVDLRPDDGAGGPHPCDRSRCARGELHRGTTARRVPGALHGRGRPRGTRVHPRPAAVARHHRHHRRRRREAPGRLRLPRPDHVVPGRRHPDGGADRERGPGRARPLRRRDARHPCRGLGRRAWGVAGGRQPARARPAHGLVGDLGEWEHAYTREQAVYPLPGISGRKYWPPVRRIDQAYGDRNLVCACPPVEAFA